MDNVNGNTRRDSPEAAFDVLRPIVRVLRASGFEEGTIRTAAERACRLYAHTAARGVHLERTRLAELARVVETWARDPDFIDESGVPMRLGLDGGRGSFRALLRRTNCSIAHHAALAELKALGSIRTCDRGRRVRLLSSVTITAMGKRLVVAPMLESIRRFIEAVEHELCSRPDPGSAGMLRWAACAALDPRHLGEVQRFVHSSGAAFLDSVSDKLLSCAASGVRRGELTYEVGLYAFMEEPKIGRPRPRRARAARSSRRLER